MSFPINGPNDRFMDDYDLHRAMSESSHDLIFVIDHQEYVRYVNNNVSKFLGASPKKVQGAHLSNLFAPDIYEFQSRALRHVFRSGEPLYIEDDKTFAARKMWVETRLIPIKGKDNRVNYVMGVGRDITELKRSQEQLRQTSNRLNAVLEASPTAIVTLDREGIVTHWNKAAERIFGWTSVEVIGKPHPIVPEEKYEEFRSLLARAMSGESLIGIEVLRRKKDGSPVDLSISVAPLHNRMGEIYGIMSLIVDVTERKRAEDKLRLFSEAVEGAPDGVQIADLSGKIIYSNKSIERIYGFSPQEYYGRSVNEMNADPEFADNFILPQIKETGQWTGELMVKHKEGRLFPIWLTTSLIKNRAGEPIAMVGIIRDITRHKTNEEEISLLNRTLLRRAAELESTYKDMESFSYAASHDLKAPVIRIAGFTEILSEDYSDRMDEYGKDCLKRISDNARKMRLLIEDLLEFSSIGAKEIHKSSIDMELLTRSAYEEIKPAGRNIRLRITAIPLADGDQSSMRQVLLNLLANAIKFTRTREKALIEVGGSTEKDESIYYVRDNGIGFDMKFVDKLFGLFQKVHIAGEYEGTGIGLVIVKRIIEKHGGRVWAEGRPNAGATFYFTLPVKAD